MGGHGRLGRVASTCGHVGLNDAVYLPTLYWGSFPVESSWPPLDNCTMVCVLYAHSPFFVISVHLEKS